MKRKLLAAAAVLLLAPLLSLGWLMKTESGLHWAYRIAAPKMPEEFSLSGLSGTLAGPIVLGGIDYRQRGFEVSAAQVELDWNPWELLTLKLDITDLQVESLRVALPAAAETAQAQAAPVELAEFVMPIAMHVDNARFDGIEIKRGEIAYRVTRASLRLDANYNRFEIGELEIESERIRARLGGKITARQGYPHEIDFDWSGQLPSGTEWSGAGVLAGDLSSTRLQQQVQGLVQVEHSLELFDLLTSPRWRLTARTAETDIRLLDPALPEIRASLEATAEGDLEAATVNGRVTGSEPRLGNFAASFRLRSLDGERRYQGIEVEALDVAALDGSIAASGRVEWRPSVSWTAEVSAIGIDPATLLAEWPGKLSASFDTSGSIENRALATRANIRRLEGELRGYPVLASGLIEWLDGSLSISALEASSGETRFAASGMLGAALDLSWSLHSDNLAAVYPGAGGSLDAEGLLRGSRDTPRIEAGIEGTSLSFDDIRLGKLGGKIAIEPLRAGQFDIDLVGEAFLVGNSEFERVTVRADPKRIEAKLASSLGVTDIRLEGGLDGQAWQGTLVGATIESREYSTWKLSEPASIELSAEHLTLARSCLQSELRGRICGTLEATAEDWDLDLDIDNLPLQLLSNLVPPRLQLTGIADLQASVAKRGTAPVEGKIDIALRDGSTQIALDSGETLRTAYREIVLNLTPGSRGIGVTGRVSMENGDHMQLDGQLPGTYLLDLDNGFREVRATLRGQLSDMTNLDALIPEFDDLAGLLEFDLTIEGDPRQPRIGGQARLSDATVDITRLDLPLTDLNITIEADGTHNINYHATAALADGSLQVSGNTRLDVEAGWPSSVSLQTTNLAPRGLLARLLVREIEIDGRFDGNAELRFRAPHKLYGKIEVVSERGKLLYPFLEGELDSLDYYNARARILLDEDGITSETSFTAEDGIAFEGRYEFPGARLLDFDPQRQALAARARIETRQLKLLQLLSLDIERPEGNFELVVEATGTLAKPQFAGQARLTDASVGIPRLGIRLTDIYLTGSSDDSDRFNFEIGARSGDGSLKITGSSQLQADRGWPTRLEINGENFESARIPEASVNLSPALVVVIADRRIDISGDLRVPFARLQPRDVTTAEKVSSDTVVIGGDKSEEDPGWLVTTRVNLILGERVAFYGYGFDGQLKGRLLIEQKPGQPTSGTGEITIPQGRYRAYGQRLDIENGRVLFTGGPVTNPGLDIRASRDSNGIITGLLVRGRLRQPHIELFSIPAMAQTDILSYLLFGRPLETASGEDSALMAQAALTLGLAGGDQIARSLRERFGLDEFHVETADSGDQASLVVGRYLSPDVYVSYAVGLIESANSLNLRYRITDRWQLKAESGVNHGADLLYTIER